MLRQSRAKISLILIGTITLVFIAFQNFSYNGSIADQAMQAAQNSAYYIKGSSPTRLGCQSNSPLFCVHPQMPSYVQGDRDLLQYVNSQTGLNVPRDPGWCGPTTTTMVGRTIFREISSLILSSPAYNNGDPTLAPNLASTATGTFYDGIDSLVPVTAQGNASGGVKDSAPAGGQGSGYVFQNWYYWVYQTMLAEDTDIAHGGMKLDSLVKDNLLNPADIIAVLATPLGSNKIHDILNMKGLKLKHMDDLLNRVVAKTGGVMTKDYSKLSDVNFLTQHNPVGILTGICSEDVNGMRTLSDFLKNGKRIHTVAVNGYEGRWNKIFDPWGLVYDVNLNGSSMTFAGIYVDKNGNMQGTSGRGGASWNAGGNLTVTCGGSEEIVFSWVLYDYTNLPIVQYVVDRNNASEALPALANPQNGSSTSSVGVSAKPAKPGAASPGSQY